MLRYTALLWNSESEPGTAAARALALRLSCIPAWGLAYEAPGLLIYCAGHGLAMPDRHILPRARGFIAGAVFRAHSDPHDEEPCAPAQFTEEESAHVVETSGRRLIYGYWGWFVAFLRPFGSRKVKVLRSPVSELPCLYSHIGSTYIVFSSVEDFRSVCAARLSVDWNYVRNQIVYGYLSMKLGEIAIDDIASLNGGDCLTISPEGISIETYWNPVSIAASSPLPNATQSAPLLRAAAKSCVGTWSAMHRSIAVRLSGGLDSSIVLSCAARARSTSARCVTYFSPGSRADERHYAAVMAQHVGASLTQRRLQHENTLARMLSVRPTSVPLCNFIDWHEYDWEQEWLRSNDVTALLSGTFGDAIFDKICHLFPAIDYFLQHRIDRGFWRVVFDLASLHGVSLWKILRFCCRRDLLGPPKGEWNVYEVLVERATRIRSFVDEDAFPETNRHAKLLLHGWLRDVRGCVPGKLCLIAALGTETFYEGHFMRLDDVPILPVLLSQPLVEVCLAIPTHLSVRGGHDRAVARQAFSAELPVDILARPRKGSPDPWLRDAVEKNWTFIREFLYDGVLLRERLLDRKKLDATFREPDGKGFPSYPGMILNLVCTEAWVRAVLSPMTRQKEIGSSSSSLSASVRGAI